MSLDKHTQFLGLGVYLETAITACVRCLQNTGPLCPETLSSCPASPAVRPHWPAPRRDSFEQPLPLLGAFGRSKIESSSPIVTAAKQPRTDATRMRKQIVGHAIGRHHRKSPPRWYPSKYEASACFDRTLPVCIRIRLRFSRRSGCVEFQHPCRRRIGEHRFLH